MAALQGLSGLYPDPQDITDVMDEGVLEAGANDPHPEHGQYGSQSVGYSGTVPTQSPYSEFAVYDGWDRDDTEQYGGMGYNIPGTEANATPVTHSSPYPRGIIQYSVNDENALARAGEQVMLLHSTDLGGPRSYNAHSPAGHEEITHYTTDNYVAPNDNVLSSDLAGQLRGSDGHGIGSHADPTQGYGFLNTMTEFNSGHSIRRVQHDTVHFDYTNTHGETAVPFYGRHPVEQMPLDGPDSPYFEQGDIDGANVPWEGRIGYPTPYEQPAEPVIVAAPADTSDNDVWAWS
jgi:hypothetical protein